MNSFNLSIIINLIIAICLFILFLILLRKITNRRPTLIYFSLSLHEIYKQCGVDVYMTLQMMKIGMWFCILNIPVFITSCIANSYGSGGLSGINKISMSNVNEDDYVLMTTHCVCLYYMSCITMGLVYYVDRKYDFIKVCDILDNPNKYRTLFISGIKDEFNTKNGLYEYFNYLHFGNVTSTFIVRDWGEEEKIYNNKINARNKYESEVCGKWRKDKTNKLSDKVNYYREKLTDEIKKEKKNLNTGFVVFDNVKSFFFALKSHDNVKHITNVDDVYWSNAAIKPNARFFRKLGITVITVVLILLWSIPVIALQAVITIENLKKWIPDVVEWLESVPFLYNLFTGFLPTIVLVIFMGILPIICYGLSILSGEISLGNIKLLQIKMLFWFNFINVFLVSMFSGAIIGSIEEMINNPTIIVNLLAEKIPEMATFFMNYILVLTCINLMVELTKVKPFVVSRIKLLFASTPREIEEAHKLEPMDWAEIFPEGLLCFVLLTTYTIISPLMLVFGFLFFLVAFMTVRFENLYVTLPEVDMCGKLWTSCFHYIMIGLFVGQITLFGIILLNKAFIVAMFCIPIFVLSIIFYIFEKNKFSIYSIYDLKCQEYPEKILPDWMK